MIKTKFHSFYRSATLSLAVAACLMMAASPGWALKRHITLDEVIRNSEHIFTAVVKGKSAELRDGNVVTTYRMKPIEFIKGRIPTDASGLFTMEEVGGSLGEPFPLVQYVYGQIPMVAGEEVLLFTRSRGKKRNMQPRDKVTLLAPSNPQIVSYEKGRYSLLTDPNTGEKLVVRPSQGLRPNTAANDRAMQRYLNEQQKKLRQLHEALTPQEQEDDKAKGVAGRIEPIREFEKLDDVRDRLKNHIQATEKQE